jgi:hypothetical protein
MKDSLSREALLRIAVDYEKLAEYADSIEAASARLESWSR